MGFQSGYLNTTGVENVFIGTSAGYSCLGNSNVMIGYRAGYSETSDNKLYIANSGTTDPLIYGEFDHDTDSSVEGLLKFNARRVGVGFEGGSMGFGAFPSMAGIANGANYRLFVRGGILAEEVRIRLQSSWADYVFSPTYKLLPLKEIEKFIAKNGHLPNMPSAAEVEEQGLEMGNIVKLQQEKIEELTLHAISQEKRIGTLEKQLQLLINKQ